MFRVLILSAIVVLASASRIFEEDYKTMINRKEIIDKVNSMNPGWTAGTSPRFANATVAEFKLLLGTVLPGEYGYFALPEKTDYPTAEAVPEAFDTRDAWPNCAGITGHVRDQSNCGSCWAFGSTEAFNDRHCIVSGDATTLFSPEDTNDCCSGVACAASMGCNGGQPSGAWKWFVNTGVSSGGDWGDIGNGKTCKPYSLQSCAHHTTPPAGMVACPTLPSYSTPKCTSTCSESKYGSAYSTDKHKAKDSYSVSATNLQAELMAKGSISVAFTVYEDFEAYTGGVYRHVAGKNLGGHAVKLIGWGVDNGVKYWTVVNSWNPSWGEKGLFRILRGSNECGIEASAVAGDA